MKTWIDVIRRKRKATKKFLKKDVADLHANGLDINAYERDEIIKLDGPCEVMAPPDPPASKLQNGHFHFNGILIKSKETETEMKYLEVEGAGRLEVEGRYRRAQ
ncbi:hypothetical protein SO802_008249 [Lithocarpus litseifolius]|uniref:Uncharacterized protein n=1 Tax=Lithocarpus litseifolius TaxID=425828 RepID=A0AAW2D8M3_9ROSI